MNHTAKDKSPISGVSKDGDAGAINNRSGNDPTGKEPTGTDPTGKEPTGTDPTGAESTTRPLKTVGWREWGRLPELGIKSIKIKIDTGANTSALHAEDLEYSQEGGKKYVSFYTHGALPAKRPRKKVKAEVISFKHIKSSNGTRTERPVIRTRLEMGGDAFEIEVSLICRGRMGYRMLLGRRALNGRFLVDPEKENLLGKPKANAPISMPQGDNV